MALKVTALVALEGLGGVILQVETETGQIYFRKRHVHVAEVPCNATLLWHLSRAAQEIARDMDNREGTNALCKPGQERPSASS